MNIDRTIAPLLALSALVVATAACGDDAGSGVAGDDAQAAAPGGGSYARVINVETRPAEESSFTETIRLTGTVGANQDVTLAAEESGRIVSIEAERGSRVDEGDALVRIDPSILRSQVQQARARAELAEEVWQRRRRLYEEDSVGTGMAYLEARADAEEAAANLEALRERLARTTVRAPFAGIFEERLVELGEMVSPGTPVARVVELDRLKVTAGVPERFAPDVRQGSDVAVTFDVMPGRTFEGEISYVGSTVNPQNRTFPVEFTLDNPDRIVKPEMVANISIVRRRLDDAVVVPQEALVRTQEGFRAFVVEGEGGDAVARARDLELGPAQENSVVVESGLRAGDRLVVVGQQQVAEGDRVRVVASAGAGPEPGVPPSGEPPPEADTLPAEVPAPGVSEDAGDPEGDR